MRLRVFGLIWVGLFAATIGVQQIHASRQDDSPTSTELIESAMRITARVRLDATPRRSDRALLSASDHDSREFVDTMQRFLDDKRDALRTCGRPIMKRSAIPTEYFELSFLVRGASGRNGAEATLKDVVVERTTIPLTPADEQCLEELFSSFVIPLDGVAPSNRTSYQLCFSHQI